MQRGEWASVSVGAVDGAVIYLPRCSGWRVDSEIAEPGNISQQLGIRSGAVWHFSTACWLVVSGVAEPCYLLPTLGPNINQTWTVKSFWLWNLSVALKWNSCSITLDWRWNWLSRDNLIPLILQLHRSYIKLLFIWLLKQNYYRYWIICNIYSFLMLGIFFLSMWCLWCSNMLIKASKSVSHSAQIGYPLMVGSLLLSPPWLCFSLDKKFLQILSSFELMLGNRWGSVCTLYTPYSQKKPQKTQVLCP